MIKLSNLVIAYKIKFYNWAHTEILFIKVKHSGHRNPISNPLSKTIFYFFHYSIEVRQYSAKLIPVTVFRNDLNQYGD
jgi:hypothetical protein